jgi:hypothetical protein
MEHNIEIRQMFDESFKRMVIEEYLATPPPWFVSARTTY